MITLLRNVYYVLVISFKFVSYCLFFNLPKDRERGRAVLINGTPGF